VCFVSVPLLTPFFLLFLCVRFIFSFCFTVFFCFLSFPSSSSSLFASQNVAGTGVSGSLPSSWGAFSALLHLTMYDTKLQCPLVVDEQGMVRQTAAAAELHPAMARRSVGES
jgi:hypothetical protein